MQMIKLEVPLVAHHLLDSAQPLVGVVASEPACAFVFRGFGGSLRERDHKLDNAHLYTGGSGLERIDCSHNEGPGTFDSCIPQCASTVVSSQRSAASRDNVHLRVDTWRRDGVTKGAAAGA